MFFVLKDITKPTNPKDMTDDLSVDFIKELQCNPLKNHDSIVIIKQSDGNWRGFMWKIDKLVQVRQSDPNTVLQLLITHE